MGRKPKDETAMSSTERNKDYTRRMKEAGHKHVSFYLTPAAHESLVKMTEETRKIGHTLNKTNNSLLEFMKNKLFLYEAFGLGGLDPIKQVEAINKAIEFMEKRLKEIQEWMAVEKAEFEAMLEHIGHEAYQEEQEFQAKLDWDANEANYQELVKSGKIK